MALVRWYEDEEFSCSHSTMYVSDSFDYGHVPYEGSPDFGTQWLTDNYCGTFVITIPGHLHCTAESDDYHRVRLELHDVEPPFDVAGWGDVLETPYESGSGSVGTGELLARDRRRCRGTAEPVLRSAISKVNGAVNGELDGAGEPESVWRSTRRSRR